MKGRPDLHVVARFLDALRDGPRSRSQLQRAVGVNYDIFVRYEALLIERGHVRAATDGLELSDAGRHLRAELAAWLARLFGG